MKKLLLLFIAIYSFGLTIQEHHQIKIEKKAHLFQTDISVAVNGKKLPHLISKIDSISHILENFKECQLQIYTINPEYRFKKDKKEFIGYTSNLLIKCKFPKNRLNTFSKLCEKLSKKGELSISSLLPTFSQKEIQKSLKQKALLYIQSKLQQYKKDLKKECYIKEVRFNSFHSPKPILKTRAYSLPSPSMEKKFHIDFFYAIECF